MQSGGIEGREQNILGTNEEHDFRAAQNDTLCTLADQFCDDLLRALPRLYCLQPFIFK